MSSLACITGSPRFFFIHVQKTGGQSISHALMQLNPDNSGRTMHDAAHSFSLWWPDEWSELPSFAFVRNPFDRWVSIYHHYYRNNYTSFREFMLDHRRWRPGWSPAIQWGMLCDNDYRVIVKHILRFEALDEGWDFICDTLGVERHPLPHMNSSWFNGRRSWRDYYDAETTRIAWEMSEIGIRLFGYDKPEFLP